MDELRLSYEWTVEDELQSLAAVSLPKDFKLGLKLGLIGAGLGIGFGGRLWLDVAQYGLSWGEAFAHHANRFPGFALGFGLILIVLILVLRQPKVQAMFWRRRVRASAPKALLGRREMVLDHEGLHVETPGSRGLIKWSAISSIEHRGDYVLFLAGDLYRFGAVPASALDDVAGWITEADALRLDAHSDQQTGQSPA